MMAAPCSSGLVRNRRRGIVDDERDAERAADRRHFGNREDRQLRIRQRFGIVGARPVIGGAQEILRVTGSTKRTSMP